MSPAKPSLELLRSLSDEHVLRALLDDRRLTRSEIAARTGISKPTVSESVRRLSAAGLLRDTGDRSGGPGRAGIYYALADGLGTALVADISPRGVVVETLDVHGDVLVREHSPLPPTPGPGAVADALTRTTAEATAAVPGPVRVATVSAADPVDRETGRLVHLPDAPFLVGELSPAEILGPSTSGPVVVDNDVNWAARAESRSTGAGDFAYLHLGEGLGCAVVSDGDVRRGRTGLAGEIAHVLTRGPGDRAIPFIDVFDGLGLRLPASTAVDVAAALRALDDTGRAGPGAALGAAVADVVAGLIAFCDPAFVVLAGPWGSHPALHRAVDVAVGRRPRRVELRPPRAGTDPSLTGARTDAVARLRSTILRASP